MNVTIQPSLVSGELYAPASKSSMQRACAAALLTNGITTITNPGKSNDDVAALDVIQKLGAAIQTIDKNTIEIHSKGIFPVNQEINCGESGLGIRMFTPIAALSNDAIKINGTGSLLTRPMDFLMRFFLNWEYLFNQMEANCLCIFKVPYNPPILKWMDL